MHSYTGKKESVVQFMHDHGIAGNGIINKTQLTQLVKEISKNEKFCGTYNALYDLVVNGSELTSSRITIFRKSVKSSKLHAFCKFNFIDDEESPVNAVNNSVCIEVICSLKGGKLLKFIVDDFFRRGTTPIRQISLHPIRYADGDRLVDTYKQYGFVFTNKPKQCHAFFITRVF